MNALQALPGGAAPETGWAAVLDPFFLLFAIVVVFTIVMMVRLAMRVEEPRPTEPPRDE